MEILICVSLLDLLLVDINQITVLSIVRYQDCIWAFKKIPLWCIELVFTSKWHIQAVVVFKRRLGILCLCGKNAGLDLLCVLTNQERRSILKDVLSIYDIIRKISVLVSPLSTN